jgi:hypothetical protein
MSTWLSNTQRWTPVQGYIIGASLMNLIRQGWKTTKANQLQYEGQPLYWEVALRRGAEALNVVVSDGSIVREIAASLSNSAVDAA